ncbi:YidH family protein [Salisediminibacterium selenitireducens]|uniref:DUF202 domain-containing protein n=1 Tax=Bacillus selenitireducens (strain ATCC 700615 / DSM 15326 / MLS10) TaxID=439292 RepID=D6XXP5_BACIE|nr:DUF202 domain-containing protein [Salisediminibacterium selenitireducens]ADI00088.1 protein of unknown function DUF202 [[Bacillus] selenitireducens MLS10]
MMGSTVDSMYIQQHLANERTFLAWLRTALAMKGIGFLIFGIELATDLGTPLTRTLAAAFSVLSFFAGMTVLVIGTVLFFRNRRTINAQQFKASGPAVLIAGIAVALVMLMLMIYVLLVSV